VQQANALFQELWRQAEPDVRRYVCFLLPRQADAEDVMQEVSIQLWRKLDEFDPDLPFVPWAIRFAYLEILKWRQRQARERVLFSEELMVQLSVTIEEESPLLEVRRRALDGCLGKLSDRDRGLLLDRYGHHGAVQQHAVRAGIDVRRLYYVVEKLRSRLLGCIEAALAREGWDHG
jgi:RNA polymerase sigma-70 factor (ECF subfamily)